MRYMMSAVAKPGLPKTGRMAYPGTGSPYHITAVREEGSPACIKVVREALGAYGREGYPLVLWLESADPFRGWFASPALERESRICFGSCAEFAWQIEELTDQVRRQMAEFDNFRKRTEKEKSAMYEIGAKSVIEKILPVVDNFERGLAGVEENSEDPFTAGMQKIYKQLMSTLESLGVKPIEATGQEFNPDFHNAVMHVEDENLGENVVAEELQKGYLYRDSVVRHSMVKVAN